MKERYEAWTLSERAMRWLLILIAAIVLIGLAMFVFGLGSDRSGGVESAALMLL
jgi:hypothetical protein